MVRSDGINSLSVGVHELAVAVERYSLSLVAQGMIDVTTLPWYTPSYVPGDSIKLFKNLCRNEAKECNIESASQDDTTFGAHKTEDDNFNKYESGELQAHVMNLELDSGANVVGSTIRDVVELTHNVSDKIGEPLSLNSSSSTPFPGAHQVLDTSPEVSPCSNRAQLARVSHEMLLSNAQREFDITPIPAFILEMAQAVEIIQDYEEITYAHHVFDTAPEPTAQAIANPTICQAVVDVVVEPLVGCNYTEFEQVSDVHHVFDKMPEPTPCSQQVQIVGTNLWSPQTHSHGSIPLLCHAQTAINVELGSRGKKTMEFENLNMMFDLIGYHIIFDPGILLLFINIARLGPHTMFYESRNGWESNISYKEAHSWGNSTVGLGFWEVPNNITELPSFQHNADCSQFYSIVIVLATRFVPNESPCLVDVALAFHVYGVLVVMYSDFNEDVDLKVTKRVVTYILVLTLEDKGVFKEVGMDSVGRLLLNLATSTWMVICTKIFAPRYVPFERGRYVVYSLKIESTNDCRVVIYFSYIVGAAFISFWWSRFHDVACTTKMEFAILCYTFHKLVLIMNTLPRNSAVYFAAMKHWVASKFIYADTHVLVFDPGGNDEFMSVVRNVFAGDLCSFVLHGGQTDLTFLHHGREIQGNNTILIFDPGGQAHDEVVDVTNLQPKECLCFYHRSPLFQVVHVRKL